MSWLYRNIARPCLFLNESERIHNLTLAALGFASRCEPLCDAIHELHEVPQLPVNLFGLRFPNPVGLAAGMDKQAVAVPVWEALGFGFSELGGVTWHAQPGNPAPRMFRAVPDEALINRMGFNNGGAPALAATLSRWHALDRWPSHPVGINLGKSKITPLEKSAEDYASSLRTLWRFADFFVVNVSSPNTPNLRQLQDKAALDEILAALQEVNVQQSRQSSTPGRGPGNGTALKPILVKVAPDLTFDALDEIVELVAPRNLAGIVATNTTITRPERKEADLRKIYAETGGLSGRPLRSRSTDVIRHLHDSTGGKVPLIGVGGIFNAEDACEKITAGASLVQIYSGLVYEGPALVGEVIRGLGKKLKERGLESIEQAVGRQDAH